VAVLTAAVLLAVSASSVEVTAAAALVATVMLPVAAAEVASVALVTGGRA